MRSSIIVVTYNHRGHIERCLQAVLRTLGPSQEVIVVDNNSSDGTLEFVAEAFPMVKLVGNARNRGFGAACNQGAQLSSADFLVFLNPDTEPCAGWLDALLGALESVPGAGLATPKLLLRASPEVIDCFGHDVHISGIATCRGWGTPAASHRTMEEVAAVSGACFAIGRELFSRLAGFDERLFLYYEDDDLSLRARFAGHACIAVPTSHVVHDHTPGFTPDKLRYLERNRLWTTLRLYRWSTLLALVPVLVGAEILGWGFAFASGPRHVFAKLRACLEVAGWLPALPTARGQVHRVVPDRMLLQSHGPRLPFAQVAAGRLACTAERLTAAAFQTFMPQ